MASREKEEIQKKQKQIDQVRKILINSASKIAAREQSSSPVGHHTQSSVDPSADVSESSLKFSKSEMAGTTAAVGVGCGSKRTLCGVSVTSQVKRPRVAASEASEIESKQTRVGGSCGRTRLDQLLLAAGVGVR